MSDRLDELMFQLSAEPSDHPLDGLEAQVVGMMTRQRAARRTDAALAAVRFASIGLALAMGVTVGGAIAVASRAEPRPFNAFAVAGHLAPSTLLEGEQ